MQDQGCHTAVGILAEFDLGVDIFEEEIGLGFRKERIPELTDGFGNEVAFANVDYEFETRARQSVSARVPLQSLLRQCDLLSLIEAFDDLVSATLTEQEFRYGTTFISQKLNFS